MPPPRRRRRALPGAARRDALFPLSFSGCINWVAGPINPTRTGLAAQRALLAAVAATTTCDAAAAALPVRPTDAGTGATCGLACADKADMLSCTPEAGTFVLPCSPPYFAVEGGVCLSDDAGLAGCVTAGACQTGLSCADTNTLRECVALTIEAYASYDCTLTGRQCATISKNTLADCVVPAHNTAPCPLRDRRDSCDGTSVLHCAGGLLAQTEYDCSAAGRSCSESNKAGVARCVGPGDACTPFDDGQSACTGAKIQVCIGGSPVSYDCGAIGKTCVAGGAGQTGHCG